MPVIRKKVIILNKPKGARLANQLWSFMSVYAYCLEKGFECRNYSFFEDKKQENKPNSLKTYYDLFQIPGSSFIRFALWIHVLLSKISTRPRIYYRYVEYIKRRFPDKIVYSGDDGAFFLPPSVDRDEKQAEQIKKFENGNSLILYLDGWFFRNPDGIEKHRDKIVEYFKPNKQVAFNVKSLIEPLRGRYKKLIGVHIRQGDYKKLFEGGRYYFNEKEVRTILDEYLDFSKTKKEDVLFLLASDEKIDTSVFEGLNFKVSSGSEAHDLFALSRCDAILGSQSTYGPFAALYGNIPFIMFERKIDWGYYGRHDMSRYFDNEKMGMLA